MNTQLKNLFRWLSTAALYVLSTVGLSAGIGATLSYGVSGVPVDAFTIKPEFAWFLGFLISLVIQWWETDWFLHPQEMTELEKILVPIFLLVDAQMIFTALGGHLNILWMLENGDNTPGMIVHTLGLVGQLIGAFLGSIGAELSLKKALGVNTPELWRYLFGKVKVNSIH
ncbi:MAG: hypothetical protein UY13_C0002G0377 [Candidatus Pacebacteria bacterium GW2011_GWB1_47_8]|nr:MAG: hypothetical protein UX28_C0001G0524 [Candidatus Pacebacteria bacterium GW2011_GWA1_46_10]KKU84465.1 MAG: hypothetical protein UY13_C0002G0377 [Candidatus Pacebacteria bacterium GW2011_GWB1_47_8]HCR81104.1 hypothetical protein [Candidatus Paceibacterota bacterium]